jgi:hypothetical protein
MNTNLSRRARLLTGIGAGAVLLGLTTAACGSSPAAAPAPSPTPSHTTTSSPAPTTTTTTPTPVGAGDSTTATKPAPIPTLGIAWQQNLKGYGTVRPGYISGDGDPTSIVSAVSWETWGGATAVGTGTSSDPRGARSTADSVQRQATVEAFDLGECDGKLVYRAVEWYFPSVGDKFDPASYLNTCTGLWVGSRH